MLGLILSSVIKESTFLKVLRSVIGLKLFGGPLGLAGFGMAIRTPELMSSSSWFVNVLFNMFAIVWSRRGVEYFSNSGYIWSSPGSLLFLSRFRFFLIFRLCYWVVKRFRFSNKGWALTAENITSSVCALLIASACLFSSSFLSCVTFFLIWCSTSILFSILSSYYLPLCCLS